MHGNICLGLVDDVVVVTLERAVVVDSEDMRKKNRNPTHRRQILVVDATVLGVIFRKQYPTTIGSISRSRNQRKC